MVLILSQYNDSLTFNVCKILELHQIEHIVITNLDEIFVDFIKITNTDIQFLLTINDIQISSSDISSYWYRRGSLNIVNKYLSTTLLENEFIHGYIKDNISVIKHFLFLYFDSLPSIGSYYYENDIRNNKLFNLLLANSCGLEIPEQSILLNSRQLLLSYLNCGTFISKSISESSYINRKANIFISAGTNKLTPDIVSQSKIKKIGYSFIQTELEKKYDVRVVVFKSKIYSALICSQDQDESKTDFRNKKIPNRICNFNLSESIRRSILSLMAKLDFDFASLDFVWTIDDRLVFLEINPNGQVGAYNVNAGWGLYEDIAMELRSYETSEINTIVS